MGSDAFVALYAPSALAPYISLPLTVGGSTGYYSPTVSAGSSTWVVTAVPGYTPSPITQLTTYRDPPTTRRRVAPGVTPDASTYASAITWTDTRAGSLSDTVLNTASASHEDTVDGTTSPTLATASSSPQSLSTGSKVGIGVGVAGGVCLFASLLIALVIMHKRHKRQAAQNSQPPQPPPQWPQSPYMGQAPPYPNNPPYQPPLGPHWHPGPQVVYQAPSSEVDTPASPKPSMSAGPNAPPSELPVEERRMAHEM